MLNQSLCEIYYTGDSQLKGLGFELPGGALGLNVMNYGYKPIALQGDHYSLSASQVEQVKRVLTYDIASNWFAGTLGHDDLIGGSMAVIREASSWMP